jgi:hypothetical protein
MRSAVAPRVLAMLVAVILSGVAAAAPLLNLSRTSVSFGRIPPAVTSEIQAVFLTNVGDAPLTISGFVFGGINPADYLRGGTCSLPAVLPVGARCRVEITATISATSSATLTVQSNSSPPATPISLSAIATPGNDIARGIFATPSWIDLDHQPIGVAAAPQKITLTNPEGANLALIFDGVHIVGGDAADFTMTSDCVIGQRYATNAGCSATIGFTPSANGPRSTEIAFSFHPSFASPGYVFPTYSVTGVGGGGGGGGVLVPDLNQHGFTGSWYQAATGGQGIEVEVFANPSSGTGSAFVSWFTYDTVTGGAERQRWYTAQGAVMTGQPSAALTIYQNTGGNFNAPPATNAQAVGTATLSFDSCSSGQLSFAFTDGTGRTGTIPLTRLTQNVTCSNTTPHPTNADFALSGNWFGGAATSGQGFTAELNPISGAFFAAWYTYIPNGSAAGAAGQRWYTAQGAFTAGLRSIPVTIYETTGGIFNTPTPAGQKTVAVGTGTMTFQSCAAATFSYSFTGGSSVGLSGSITLSRVGPPPPGCTT